MMGKQMSEKFRESLREAAGLVLADVQGDSEGACLALAGMDHQELQDTALAFVVLFRGVFNEESGDRGEGAPAGPVLRALLGASRTRSVGEVE